MPLNSLIERVDFISQYYTVGIRSVAYIEPDTSVLKGINLNVWLQTGLHHVTKLIFISIFLSRGTY